MSITIHKKIVLNEENKPVEVIISYDEWKKIEHALRPVEKGLTREQLKEYACNRTGTPLLSLSCSPKFP